MGSIGNLNKPHAVCIPYPTQGHVNPFMKLAKLLHHQEFHITFVNTDYNHKRLLKSRGVASLSGVPDFQFRSIPDGLPPSDVEATQDIPSLSDSITKNFLAPFRDLVTELNNTPNIPPVSCILSDANMVTFTLDVADELGIPCVVFWTASACGLMGTISYRHLVHTGIIPLKDESDFTNGYLKRHVDWIPGFEDLCLADLPTFIRTTDENDIMLNFFINIVEKMKKATAIVLNSFDAFEDDALGAVRSGMPPIYTIGSFDLFLKQISRKNGLNSIGSSLWKEDPTCLQWLDSQEPNSVLYVNFGSITVMTADQLTEFAWGLANSNHPFLWVVRPDLVSGNSLAIPPEFIEETKERSMLVSWCAQEQVLAHPSVAGFLTHSGWNSTLESVCSGVPMICWPFFAEQQTNCRFACTRWGIGMEIDNNVHRYEVESLVRELIEGEKGKEMKLTAMDWKKKFLEAVEPGGSSSQNIDKFVNALLGANSFN